MEEDGRLKLLSGGDLSLLIARLVQLVEGILMGRILHHRFGFDLFGFHFSVY